MQLILLSGGSGKRLWPLSNNARSKQFLPLLEKENGEMESMVQRVVRQAQEANLTNDITLATNASQLDIIQNQLGERVSVVTEPERRDTFPAIALAASYLKLKKKCEDDEVVVIMPCDPYTELEYFHTIARMVECVEKNVADLVLMGIKPTYPSAKYGYVVPFAEGEKYQIVKRFTEKPDVPTAEKLLEEGAYWNGGVFAFRLGYMMQIVRKYMQSENFEDTRARYSEFPKISFDYEVHHASIGNAVMGSHCENTHVINELQLPLYVDGLKDAVVAASPDGIFVCAKKYSEDIKKAVEHLTPRPMYEERRWGTYRVIDDSEYADGNHSLTKSITLKPGKNISYQLHHHRSEVWTFVEGEGIFVLDGEEKHVKAGDTVVIPLEHYHAIKAITQLTFIEVQNGNPLVEEDIERFDYQWKMK